MNVVDAHIQYFLGRGQIEQLNKRDTNGYAPIHYAAKFNRYDIMKKLIGAGESSIEGDEDDTRSGKKSKLYIKQASTSCRHLD